MTRARAPPLWSLSVSHGLRPSRSSEGVAGPSELNGVLLGRRPAAGALGCEPTAPRSPSQELAGVVLCGSAGGSPAGPLHSRSALPAEELEPPSALSVERNSGVEESLPYRVGADGMPRSPKPNTGRSDASLLWQWPVSPAEQRTHPIHTHAPKTSPHARPHGAQPSVGSPPPPQGLPYSVGSPQPVGDRRSRWSRRNLSPHRRRGPQWSAATLRLCSLCSRLHTCVCVFPNSNTPLGHLGGHFAVGESSRHEYRRRSTQR